MTTIKLKPAVSHNNGTIELRNPESINGSLPSDNSGGYSGQFDYLGGKGIDAVADVLSAWFGSKQDVNYNITTGNTETKRDNTWMYVGIGAVVLVLIIVLVLSLRK